MSTDDLSSANALTAFSRQMGRLLGPLLGAACVTLVGPVIAFAFDGLTFVVSALCMSYEIICTCAWTSAKIAEQALPMQRCAVNRGPMSANTRQMRRGENRMDIRAHEGARQKSIEVFCCYAREDQPLLIQLQKHLKPLQQEELITLWADSDIGAGVEWEKEIHHHLNTAQIILLLISPDFMNSDYCYSIEMTRAMERHGRGEAQVIPIILRSIDWQSAPFGKLQALPTNASPITSRKWHDQDEAFLDVAKGIREAAKARLAEEERAHKAAEAEQTHLAEEERARKAAEAEQARLIKEDRRRKAAEVERARLAEEERARKAAEVERALLAAEEQARKAEEARPPTPSIPASSTPLRFRPRNFPTPSILASSTSQFTWPPSLNQQLVQPRTQSEKVPATTKQRVRWAIIVDAFILNLLGTSVGLGILLHAWWIAVICLVGESLLTGAGLPIMAFVKNSQNSGGPFEPRIEVPRRALLVLLLPIGIVWGLMGWFLNPFVSSQIHFLYLPQGLAAVGFLLGLSVNFFISSPIYLWLARKSYWSSGDRKPADGKRQAPINGRDMLGVPNSLVISIPLGVWSGYWGIFFLSLLCSLILLTLCIAFEDSYLIIWPTIVICALSWGLIGWLIGSWPAHLFPVLNSAILHIAIGSISVMISWGEIIAGAVAIVGFVFALPSYAALYGLMD